MAAIELAPRAARDHVRPCYSQRELPRNEATRLGRRSVTDALMVNPWEDAERSV